MSGFLSAARGPGGKPAAGSLLRGLRPAAGCDLGRPACPVGPRPAVLCPGPGRGAGHTPEPQGDAAFRRVGRTRSRPRARLEDGRSARSGRQVHALVVLSPRGEGRAGQRGGRGGGGEDEATRRDRLRVRTAWVLNRVHFKNSAAPVNLITAATIWRFVEMFYFAVRFKSLEHASRPSGRPLLGAPRCPGPEEERRRRADPAWRA